MSKHRRRISAARALVKQFGVDGVLFDAIKMSYDKRTIYTGLLYFDQKGRFPDGKVVYTSYVRKRTKLEGTFKIPRGNEYGFAEGSYVIKTMNSRYVVLP